MAAVRRFLRLLAVQGRPRAASSGVDPAGSAARARKQGDEARRIVVDEVFDGLDLSRLGQGQVDELVRRVGSELVTASLVTWTQTQELAEALGDPSELVLSRLEDRIEGEAGESGNLPPLPEPDP